MNQADKESGDVMIEGDGRKERKHFKRRGVKDKGIFHAEKLGKKYI